MSKYVYTSKIKKTKHASSSNVILQRQPTETDLRKSEATSRVYGLQSQLERYKEYQHLTEGMWEILIKSDACLFGSTTRTHGKATLSHKTMNTAEGLRFWMVLMKESRENHRTIEVPASQSQESRRNKDQGGHSKESKHDRQLNIWHQHVEGTNGASWFPHHKNKHMEGKSYLYVRNEEYCNPNKALKLKSRAIHSNSLLWHQKVGEPKNIKFLTPWLTCISKRPINCAADVMLNLREFGVTHVILTTGAW